MARTPSLIATQKADQWRGADSLYGISRWGQGLFQVLDNGHLAIVRPDRPRSGSR